MLSVLCPTIFMAVDRGTLARSRFRTAVPAEVVGNALGYAGLLARSHPGAPEGLDRLSRAVQHPGEDCARRRLSCYCPLPLALEDGPQVRREWKLAALVVFGLTGLKADRPLSISYSAEMGVPSLLPIASPLSRGSQAFRSSRARASRSAMGSGWANKVNGIEANTA
jgi:hypothetical protein